MTHLADRNATGTPSNHVHTGATTLLHDEWFFHPGSRGGSIQAAALRCLLRRGNTVLDIGANVGRLTAFSARLAGPHGHVFAFEPNVDVLPLLAHNLSLHNAWNTTILAVAIGREDAVVTLDHDDAMNARTHTAPHFKSVRRSLVRATTLDNITALLDIKPDLVVVDTEDTEEQVIAGAETLISRHAPIFLVDNSSQSPHLFSCLKRRNYTALSAATYEVISTADSSEFVERSPSIIFIHASRIAQQDFILPVTSQHVSDLGPMDFDFDGKSWLNATPLTLMRGRHSFALRAYSDKQTAPLRVTVSANDSVLFTVEGPTAAILHDYRYLVVDVHERCEVRIAFCRRGDDDFADLDIASVSVWRLGGFVNTLRTFLFAP